MATLSKRPPGPQGRFLIGNFPLAARNPLALYTEWGQKFGDIFYYRSGLRRVYFLNHPDLVEELLIVQAQNFTKDWVFSNTRWLFGNGLVTAEAAEWKRQRNLLQPMFHRERVVSYAATMTAYTEQAIATWRTDQIRRLHKDMMELTLRMSAQALFGVDLGSETEKFRQTLNDLTKSVSGNQMLLPAFLRFLPLPGSFRFRRMVAQFDALVHELISERRTNGDHRFDLLSMLLELRDEDGGAMTEQQVRDEVITFLVAGHGTTAMVLCWVWYLLSQHPAVEKRLHEELKDILGGRTPSFEDVPRLKYTAKIVRESIRLYPPVWAFGRTAAQA